MLNIILSGGSGTRMWPVSRKRMPKQFYPLIEGKSLYQHTLERNIAVCNQVIVVTNEQQYELALAQSVAHANAVSVILEPIGRNTAPAIALACLNIDPETVVLVTPSDHLITKTEAYHTALHQAKMLAEQGYLVTFGIQPSFPETGFGYIEADGNDVRSFKEKPNLATAQAYVGAGNYYWNSGMFCFKAGVYLSELKKYAPEVFTTSQEAFEQTPKSEPLSIPLEAMKAIPDISIDYGVMEKSALVKVVPADIGWSDLGSFDALYEQLPIDVDGNTQTEQFLSIGSQNNLLLSGGKRLIAMIDVEDLIVIDTKDALLLCKKGSSQKVKQVVDALKANDSYLTEQHID